MLVRDAEVLGVGRCDVRVVGDRIAEIGEALRPDGTEVIEASGGALLPGLHDHHIHLLATAAALASVDCGPPLDERGLSARLHAAGDGWVRGVGYHDSVAGDLDRWSLDRLRDDTPVRIQERSGALWVLNGAAVRELGLDDAGAPDHRGVERDLAGRSTGRLWRADDLLRSRLPAAPPELREVSCRLAELGVTGVTDATPELGALPARVAQRVVLLGAEGADLPQPRKLVVADHDLPPLAELTGRIRRCRPRPVAVHCVTRAALVLTLAALAEAGAIPGDRIEHAAVVPGELLPVMHGLALTVVTQPSLPWRRGDVYLADVDPDDRAGLWPYRTLTEAGIPVGCSSDAPYGDLDPWASIAAATRRVTATGRPIGLHQRVEPATALAGYLSDPLAPGGPTRRVEPGATADLVLLAGSLREVLAGLAEGPMGSPVVLTMIGGVVVHRRPETVAR